jgi:NAD(P)-dependent dehydrogenase (short-subunit alcohol dehydrogenase family)
MRTRPEIANEEMARAPGTVVVTGGSAGVGRATALAFARRGWNVAVLARGRAGLEGARHAIERAGGHALPIGADMSDPDAVLAAADRVLSQWCTIDVWINNAMVTVFGPVDRVPPREFRRVTEVTYLGAVHGTLAALRHMRARNAGTIVQVGSALAYRAVPLQAAYCGAKFALRGFTDALRCELCHDASAIKLTMVQLPGVNTPQFTWSRTHMRRRHRPLGVFYQPEPIGEAIFHAACNAPRECWIGIPAFKAVVGNMLAPGLLDRYLAATAYEEQMSAQPAGGGHGILFEPATEDHGARGPFNDRAEGSVWAFNPALARGALAVAGVGLAAGALFLGWRRATTPRGQELRAPAPAHS